VFLILMEKRRRGTKITEVGFLVSFVGRRKSGSKIGGKGGTVVGWVFLTQEKGLGGGGSPKHVAGIFKTKKSTSSY